MSGLNINSNTLYTIFRGERGIYQPLVSASVFLYGGGGDGRGVTAVSGSGGGGGAGSVISGSIQIVPYMINTVVVGGGASGSANGNPTYFEGFTDDEFTRVSAIANGGSTSTGINGGGNGGGNFAYPSFTQSFSAYSGGTGTNAVGTDGNLYIAGGGGAGSAQNGENSTFAQPALQGGNGGNGVTASIETFGTPIDTEIGALGAAGGGGAGAGVITSTGVSSEAGNVPSGGFYGGLPGANPALPRFGAGGGGGYWVTGIPAYEPTSGSDGAFIIVYCGEPKLEITNGNTVYDSGSNSTYHILNKGTGSFSFAPQFLNVPQCI